MNSDIPQLSDQASSSRRPIIHHLNADTTWLIQLPQPPSSPRRWYNIVLDPWLAGPQSDVASWFSKQWHAIPPALSSIPQVEELCRSTESPSSSTVDPTIPIIDVIAISHEFTDHCHQETLLQFKPSTPIFAATKAAALISSWKHFDTVIETPPFDAAGADWRNVGKNIPGEKSPLPEWISISRLVTSSDALYYHSAIMITFSIDNNNTSPAESIIYTPHGIHAPSLSGVSSAQPPIQCLALLHGLHDVSIDWGQQLNLGAINGLEVQRALKAKYWISTHDEIKHGGGLVSWLLRRKALTVKEALENEAEWLGEKLKEGENVLGDGVFLDMKNGESRILE